MNQNVSKNGTVSVQHFFDAPTNTLTYAVWDQTSKDAVVIDPVLDYNHHDGFYHTKSADELASWIKSEGLNLHYILETHAHADHLTGAQILKKHFPHARVAISEKIDIVRKTFCDYLSIDENQHGRTNLFDHTIKDHEVLNAGTLKIKALLTPGHTPACMSYLIGDALFTGDILFMPDYGTGRCDFPKGSAEDLYDSVAAILYTLPEETRVFTGHDYMPKGRELKFMSTIKEEKLENIRLNSKTSKNEFVKFRKERDAELDAPKLLIPSIQVNIFAGFLPKDGILKTPIRQKKS